MKARKTTTFRHSNRGHELPLPKGLSISHACSQPVHQSRTDPPCITVIWLQKVCPLVSVMSINQRHPFWRRSQHHSPRLWKAGVGTSLRELHVAGWEEGSCVGETGSGMVREDNP